MFEVFMAVKIQVMALWVVTPCSDIVGYQHFRGPCCLQLQGDAVKILCSVDSLLVFHGRNFATHIRII
jgi:hypothetical protein